MKRTIVSLLGKFLCKLTTLRNRTAIASWRRKLGSVHSSSILEYPLKISNAEFIHIGPEVRISWGGWLCAVKDYYEQSFRPEISIAEGSYIGNNCHLVATKKIRIGREVLLADRVYVSDNMHEYRNIDVSIMKNDLISCGEVHIGDHSWIGENVCIVGDVRIGRHCVVGANAVVNRSLPDYSVAVGAPARVIKRYSKSTKQWEATDAAGRFSSESPLDDRLREQSQV